MFFDGRYDRTTFVTTKNEVKVCIPCKYMIKLQSSNEKISYTMVSLVNHDGDSLDCGNYVSDVFDSSTGIWWHCDYDNITELSDLPHGVYYSETHKPTEKKRLMMGSSKVLSVVYIRTSRLIKHSYNFFEEYNFWQKLLSRSK